ncbi:MAG: DUF3341 domain-containing protein [Phycisphaerales bacterium]|nr:DUF3341 domain-containing protein [Phycisphaerales bacterium]
MSSTTGTMTATSAHPKTHAKPVSMVLHGLLAEFDDDHKLVAACKKVRDAGYTDWDAHSPFPVHGIDRAMGISMTKLPIFIFFCGALGTATGVIMQWWMNAVDYPFLISGKPFWSLPANIPVIFELTILFSALSAVIGMFAFNGLPRHYNPLFRSERFKRATDDRFFISVLASDPRFNLNSTRSLLESAGAAAVERVDDTSESEAPPRLFIWAHAILLCLALIPIAMIYRARNAPIDYPRLHVIFDMDNQEKYAGKQAANPAFVDGRAMRLPVAGTVARGMLRQDPALTDGRVGDRWLTVFPANVTIDDALLKRGQNRYEIFCAPCHGFDGSGNGRVTDVARERGLGWVEPKNLHDEDVRLRPVGHLYNTVKNGIRTMPPYGDQISGESDRWAVVAYIKALQRSQRAAPGDVPTEKKDELNNRK